MRPPPIETWPEWANYCAEELSASWYFYAEKPRYMELVGGWISKGRCELVPRVTVTAKDSLISRTPEPLFTPAQSLEIVKACYDAATWNLIP